MASSKRKLEDVSVDGEYRLGQPLYVPPAKAKRAKKDKTEKEVKEKNILMGKLRQEGTSICTCDSLNITNQSFPIFHSRYIE